MAEDGTEEGLVQLKPTMGSGMDEYRLLLNVTSRGGKLERRPAVIARHMGYGYNSVDSSGSDAFQNRHTHTDGTSADYADATVNSVITLKFGALGGSDTPVPADNSYLTLTLNHREKGTQEIKVAFSATGSSPTAFSANGADKVILNLNNGHTDTNDCNEIASYVRTALNALTSAAVNGVDLLGWTVGAVGGSAGARTIVLTAASRYVSDMYDIQVAEYVDTNSTLSWQNTASHNHPGQYRNRYWVAPGMSPVDTHQTKNGTIAQAIEPIVDATYHPAPIWNRIDVVEGVDVEMVNGKLVCFYAAKYRFGQTLGDASGGKKIDDAGNTDIRMHVSVHSPADPMIGALGLAQRATPRYSGLYRSPATAWSTYERTVNDGTVAPDLMNERPLRVGATESMKPASTYNAVKFWQKRIQRVSSGFVVSGYGVGGGVWDSGPGFTEFTENLEAFDDAGTQVTTTTTISDPEGLLWFTGLQLPFYKLGSPVTDVTRWLSKSMEYAKRRPHRAFMFTDPQGYPVWYGFQRMDVQEVQQALPETNAFNEGVPVQLRAGTKYFLDPGMVWYGEAYIPNSLPAPGYMTAVAAARNPEVVGMSNTVHGTVCFTRDTIELLSGNYTASDFKTVHTGIGADSRWSILNVGSGTAFANKDGIHFMGANEATGEGSALTVRRIKGFDELFGDGVGFERTPYSDLVVGDATTESVADHTNTDSRYSQEFEKVDKHGSLPTGTYRVDKGRLDRAVACVWDDLYLCAVSRDVDQAGDDNRLILVWNYKDDTCSVWLMPKDMGVRGFAYDGGITSPYFMTRYGLAQFGSKKQHDAPWWPYDTGAYGSFRVDKRSEIAFGEYGDAVNPGAYVDQDIKDMKPVSAYDRQVGDAATKNDQWELPVVLAGQTNFISAPGAFVTSRIMVTHEKHRFGWTRDAEPAASGGWRTQNDWGNFKKDDDTDMRVQVWGNHTDLEAGTMSESFNVSAYTSDSSEYDMKSFVMSDVGMLDSLYSGSDEKEFRSVRVHPVNINGGAQTVDVTHGHLRYGSGTFSDANQTPSRRLRGSLVRTSSGRSHVAATKQQIQFYTLDPGRIYSVLLKIDKVMQPGVRG